LEQLLLSVKLAVAKLKPLPT